MISEWFGLNKIKTVGSISSFLEDRQEVHEWMLNESFFDQSPEATSVFSFGDFHIQSPVEWFTEKSMNSFIYHLKDNLADYALGYLSVSPIVICVSAAVYMLFGMFSKTIAKMGVAVVVLYSGFVYIFA